MTTARKLIDRGSSGEFGSHGMRNWLKCARLGVFEENGVEGAPVDSHVRGNMGHTALAHLYKNDPNYLTPEEAVDAYDKLHPTDFNAKWVPRVKEMLAAYRQQYNGDKQWKVLGVENVVRIKVRGTDGEAVPYSMRYDLAVERKGLVYLVDHKFTFGIIPKVIDSYRLDGQILGLHLGGRAKWREKFGGVVLNFIQLTEKSMDFRRPTLRIPPPCVQDYKLTILEAHRQRARFIGKEPMEVPGVFGEACMGKYGPCPHRARCGRDVL